MHKFTIKSVAIMKEGAVGNNALYVGVGKGLFNDTLSSWLHYVKMVKDH